MLPPGQIQHQPLSILAESAGEIENLNREAARLKEWKDLKRSPQGKEASPEIIKTQGKKNQITDG